MTRAEWGVTSRPCPQAQARLPGRKPHLVGAGGPSTLGPTYPDEDEGVGVPDSVLPLRYLDHGELHWACAMTHEVLHLWAMAETQPSSLPEHSSPFTYWVKTTGCLSDSTQSLPSPGWCWGQAWGLRGKERGERFQEPIGATPVVPFPSDSGIQWTVLSDQPGADSYVHCVTGLQLRNLPEALLGLMTWRPRLTT